MKIKITKQDKEFSHFIRARARWRCELCKRKFPEEIKKLDCAHFFGRRNKSVRYDQDNASALCFYCHKYLGENPLLHYWYQYQKLGPVRLSELTERYADSVKTKFEKMVFKRILG